MNCIINCYFLHLILGKLWENSFFFFFLSRTFFVRVTRANYEFHLFLNKQSHSYTDCFKIWSEFYQIKDFNKDFEFSLTFFVIFFISERESLCNLYRWPATHFWPAQFHLRSFAVEIFYFQKNVLVKVKLTKIQSCNDLIFRFISPLLASFADPHCGER